MYILIILLIILISVTIYGTFVKPVKFVRNMNSKNKARIKNSEYKTELSKQENKLKKEVKKKTLTPKQKLIIHTKLGSLYRDGIPDKYDSYGNKIRGVEPNAEKSIYHLNTAKNMGSLQAAINLGKLYHYGMHKFKPNLDKAQSIYDSLMFSIIDNQTRLDIRELTDDLIARKNTGNQVLRRPEEGIQVINPQIVRDPPRLNDNIQPQLNNADENIVNRHRNIVNPLGMNPVGNNLVMRVQPIHRPTVRGDVRNRNIRNDANARNAANARNGVNIHRRVRNDTQNVHDSTVIKTIKNSINKLKEVCKIKKHTNESVREIRTMLKKLDDNDKKIDAIKALDTIEKSTQKLSFSDMKEVDLLNLVWNRIHDDCNKDNIDNLKKNLTNELSESIEYGLPVCATGRFNRIIDTLNKVDPLVNIIPTGAINQEMMTKAAKIREEILNEYSDADKKLIDSAEPSLIQEQFETHFKDKIRSTFRENYVDKNILTQSKMDSLIEPWIDYI